MALYKNKYRIESTRLQNWNYGWNGKYFITVLTKNRINYFGEIKSRKMYLSDIGIIADKIWCEIIYHTKNVKLDAFVVMPNHIHGILILDKDCGNENKRRDNACVVSTPTPDNSTTLQNSTTVTNLQTPKNKKNDKTIGQKRFQNQGKNTISSIIGGYKSAVSKHAHRLGFEFNWQSRFYDVIIKNDTDYERIKNYIINNPQNWNNDISKY